MNDDELDPEQFWVEDGPVAPGTLVRYHGYFGVVVQCKTYHEAGRVTHFVVVASEEAGGYLTGDIEPLGVVADAA